MFFLHVFGPEDVTPLATHIRCRARVSLFILAVHYNLFIHTLISMYLEIYFVETEFQNILKLLK